MAITPRAAGGTFKQSSTGNGTAINLVAGVLTDDLELGFAVTRAQSIGLNSAQGFGAIPSGSFLQGTGGTGAGITGFYRFRNGDTGTPNVTDSGVMQLTSGMAFVGVDPVDPWGDIVTAGQGSGTAGLVSGLETVRPNSMVLLVAGFSGPNSDANGFVDTFDIASLVTVAQGIDWTTATGGGAGMFAMYGIKATAGPVGDMELTTDSAVEMAFLAIALNAADESPGGGGGGGAPDRSMPRGATRGANRGQAFQRSLTKLGKILVPDRRIVVPVGAQLQGA